MFCVLSVFISSPVGKVCISAYIVLYVTASTVYRTGMKVITCVFVYVVSSIRLQDTGKVCCYNVVRTLSVTQRV
jgi:hypothetical protein